ncbi:MAG UNVERIFIED_CONTAM: hypothetical protein LVR18_03670 [Planctomycetaceae bacterium]|jgi:hypothetical protein
MPAPLITNRPAPTAPKRENNPKDPIQQLREQFAKQQKNMQDVFLAMAKSPDINFRWWW